MTSKTSLVASQVRLREWALQIQECNNRPKGMDVGTWCEQHSITKANYYYRLRRVRKACLDCMDETEITTPSFVELPASIEPPMVKTIPAPDTSAVAQVNLPNGLKIELFHTATTEFMKSLFEASAYVK